MNKVRFYRERAYYTQMDLAQLVGVLPQTISNIERGKHQPRPRIVRKLAEVLQVPIEQLFPKEQTDEPEPLSLSVA